MATTTGRLDLTIWRNDDTYEYPLRVVGLDLTDVALAMQVRLERDAPGQALVTLDKVTNANAEGLRVAAVEMVGGLAVTDLRIRLNKSTRQALPYAGEMGDDALLSYALLIAGITRLVGTVTVLAHAYASDAAPVSRPAGRSSSGDRLPASGATLTITNAVVSQIVIDGAGSQEAARRAEAAAIEAVATNARASLAQRSPFQPAATFDGALSRDELRGFLLDADLSDWNGYDPTRVYSFASILKSSTQVVLNLFEQIGSGNYVQPEKLVFSAVLADGYDPTSRNVLVLKSTAGVGRIAIVPAALPNSNSYRTTLNYAQSGLDDHVFRKGYGPLRLADAAGAQEGGASLRDRHLWGAGTIREFPRRRQLLLDGTATSLVVAHCPADSYTADDDYVALEAREWKAEMGDGGPGWIGFGFPPSKDSASNAEKSLTDNVQGCVDNALAFVIFVSGTWAGRFSSNEFSPDLCSARSTVAGSQIDVTYAGTTTIATVELDYTAGAGTGVVEYRWNGAGGWTSANLSGAGGAKVALAGVPAGAWTLSIRVKAGSGQCELNGLVALTGLPGVVVHGLANNGSSASGAWAFLLNGAEAAGKRAAHAASLSRLGPIHVFSALIGTNDQNGYTTDQYAAAMRAIINDQLRQPGRLGCDILWQVAPETRTSSGFTAMADFLAVAKVVAAEKRVALLSYQELFGDAPAQYSATGTHRQLIGPDSLHPNEAGGATMRAARRNALTYRS